MTNRRKKTVTFITLTSCVASYCQNRNNYHQTMNNERETYKKSAGTSGIQGQLYESKLFSLINFRLLHHASIDQFSVTTNRNDAGAFDDICFKANIKRFEKPQNIAVFIQAKHKENNKRLIFTSKTDWAKYFNSYLKIRRAFESSSKDMIFGGNFDETECFFAIYTTAKGDSNNKIYEGSYADYLNELIGTGGCCTQPSYTDEDLNFLCKIVIKEQITTLAEQLAKFVCGENDSAKLMNNNIIESYHVILAQSVLHVSEIQPKDHHVSEIQPKEHRIASFRQDFFTTDEEFIVLFKNTLCLEVLKNRKSEETNLKSVLLKFLDAPSDVTTLSKLIGSVLSYKNSKLEFVDKPMTDDLKQQLNKANVSQSTVYGAAELAAKEYLLSRKLKVPASFGNKDLTIRNEKRLNYLTSKIIEILEKSNPNNIVTIDESLEKGFLKLNGGIASAVGNILVFDESSKLLKFTDKCESLGKLAKTWYNSLKSKIDNLHEYKFDVKVKNFPKLSFEREEYDVSLVRDFYDKLLFYTNQADYNGVEEILRGEIEDHPCYEVNKFTSDVIFLKYHTEIQNLWLMPKEGLYLTKTSNIYEKAVSNALKEPIMDVLNIMHNIKNKNYTFKENAIKPFELHGQIIGTIIATGSCVLTVAKVEQYLQNKDRVVLDLESIFKLPLENYNTLCTELTNTTKEKILIIVCNHFQGSRNSFKRLEKIAKAVDRMQIIIISNNTSVDIMTQYFHSGLKAPLEDTPGGATGSQVSNVLYDELAVFTDLSVESRKKFLATCKIKVQGEVVTFNENATVFIDEHVFSKLINNETIEIGDMAVYSNYRMQCYIVRRVSHTKNQKHHYFPDVKNKVLKTFYDLEDRVVLITGELGMGKSTLLTHLSLKTKKLHPEVWIVRINLPEHEKMVRILNGEKVFNTSIFFNFVCQAALFGEEYYKRQKEELTKKDLWYLDGKAVKLKNSKTTAGLSYKYFGGKSKEFMVKMFIDYYYTGKLILLFDGLDEIKITSKWQLEKAVSSLHTLVNGIFADHKVWITSRSLNIIEQEFGPSYKLENFSCLEQDTYLNTLWKSNIKLKNLLNIPEHYRSIDFHHFLNRNKIEYLRGYALFLDFLKMESSAAGIDFPYDKYCNEYMTSVGLCDSTIPCFPDDTMPWDLSALALRFIEKFEVMRHAAIVHKPFVNVDVD